MIKKEELMNGISIDITNISKVEHYIVGDPVFNYIGFIEIYYKGYNSPIISIVCTEDEYYKYLKILNIKHPHFLVEYNEDRLMTSLEKEFGE